MKRILFYISGHGYGHATRCLEVIKNIQLMDPTCQIHIQTSAPEWLISLNLRKNYKLISKSCDVGAVQKDSYNVDRKGTLEAFSSFWQTIDQKISEEVHYIRKNKINLIVGDIPPFAFLAAAEATVPSIAIANFSWDWIYEPYLNRYPEYTWVVDEVRRCYQKADLLLRLPFHGDLSVFPKRIDIPLIARKAWMEPQEVRQKLNVSLKEKLVLVALRKEDLAHIDFRGLTRDNSRKFLFFTPVPESPNLISVAADFLSFPNLVTASDVVVSKPGYGIISECFVNKIPLLYTSRHNFREYDILVENLQRINAGRLIQRNDFVRGKWGEYLNEIEHDNDAWPDWPFNGAERAAEKILSF